MKNGKYHKEFGIPTEAVSLFTGFLPLQYGPHAQQAAMADLYGQVAMPAAIAPTPEQVIEVEVQDGFVEKGVVRLPWDDGKDLILVINAPRGQPRRFVRTVWWNRKRDTHRTLRQADYVCVASQKEL